MYVSNSVDKTKLSFYTPHRRNTIVSVESYPLKSFAVYSSAKYLMEIAQPLD